MKQSDKYGNLGSSLRGSRHFITDRTMALDLISVPDILDFNTDLKLRGSGSILSIQRRILIAPTTERTSTRSVLSPATTSFSMLTKGLTALKFEEVRRLVVDGAHVIDQEILLQGYGRVRDLKIVPDGALYVLTNSPDAVLRIKPQ